MITHKFSLQKYHGTCKVNKFTFILILDSYHRLHWEFLLH